MILLLYGVPSVVVGLSVFQRVKAGPFPYFGPRAHTHTTTHAAPAPPSRSMHARTVTAAVDVVVAVAAALHHVSRPRLLRPCSHTRHRIIIYIIISYIRVSRSRGRSAPHIIYCTSFSPPARARRPFVFVCVCVFACTFLCVCAKLYFIFIYFFPIFFVVFPRRGDFITTDVQKSKRRRVP